MQNNLPAILIERGGMGTWSEPEVDACCEDVRSLLRHLEILPGGNLTREQEEIVEGPLCGSPLPTDYGFQR